MHIKYRTPVAAAILALLVLVTGCATKRDVAIVDEKINRLRAEHKQTQEMVERLDSLLNVETEESIKLRAEIRSSLGTIIEQSQMSQNSLAEIQTQLANLPQSSPGRLLPPITPPDSAADSTGPVIAGINCQELYDNSFINVRRGEYDEAIAGFTDYLEYCGSGDLADNSRFWIGESFYSMEKYHEAIGEFERLTRDFPNSEKCASAMYKTARAYEELGRKGDAVNTFKKVVDDYPGTLEAEQAREKLNELE